MFSVKKYEPRKATPEEACRYFLSYHSDAPEALFGTTMEKEAYLNAETPGWLREAQPSSGGASPPRADCAHLFYLTYDYRADSHN